MRESLMIWKKVRMKDILTGKMGWNVGSSDGLFRGASKEWRIKRELRLPVNLVTGE